MADTDYPVNSPLAVKRWSAELMKEALKKTFALQFMGEDTNNIIQIKTELNKGAGDRITFGIRQQLAGAGVQGDNTLEGNEEALETYTQNITIDQLRHAVRSNGKVSEQRVAFNIRNEIRDGLADWWSDRIDSWFFNQISGNTAQADVRYTGLQATTAPDAGHAVYANIGATVAAGTIATAEASLSATTVARFHLGILDRARERAKLAVNTMRPVMVGNKSLYVAFLHPTQVTALRISAGTSLWQDIQQALLQAGDADDNPIYTGAVGLYNQTVIHESTRVPRVVGATAGTADVSRGILAGAQAACMAFGRGYGKNTFDWNEELFDYRNKLGVEAGCIGGLVKTRFNGSDFAAITMSSYEPTS
jgi:N4-gp56 family major capsid protein